MVESNRDGRFCVRPGCVLDPLYAARPTESLVSRVLAQTPNDRQQDSGCKKAVGKRDTAIRGGTQLRRVGPHVVSLGAGLFADVGFALAGRPRFLVNSLRSTRTSEVCEKPSTGSREIGAINCWVPWVEHCDFLVSDCHCV